MSESVKSRSAQGDQFAAPPASPQIQLQARAHARSRFAVTAGAVFALFCAAVIGLDVPSSFAEGGLFDEVFAGSSVYRYVVQPLRYNRGKSYAHARHHRRHARWHGTRIGHGAPRTNHAKARRVDPKAVAAVYGASVRPVVNGRRSVCVRACDGHFFPVAYGGVATQEVSCGKICPGAETRVFVLPAGSDNIEDAVSARGGEKYSALLARLGGDAAGRSKACSCNSMASRPGELTALMNDSTLRPGDTVVTPQGVRVVRYGSHFPFKSGDFLSLAETRDVSREKRGALAAIERAMKTPHGRLAVMSDHHRGDRRHKREQRSDVETETLVKTAARN